jgi:hypothetical protein
MKLGYAHKKKEWINHSFNLNPHHKTSVLENHFLNAK